MNRRVVATAFVLAAVCHIPTDAQTPVRDSRDVRRDAVAVTTPTGTGTISGVVTTADPSPAALRMANVALVGAATGVMRLTATDRSGRFSFQQLPVDRYTLAASKLPFLGTIAGSRRPARPGTPIALSAGQSVTDVVIRMPRGAAISGVITDERGRPASGVGLGVLPVRMEGGQRVLGRATGSLTMTDEGGRYRIHGLAPGAYAVTAMSLRGGRYDIQTLNNDQVDAVLRGDSPPPSSPLVPSGGPAYSPVPVYFPGTIRPGDAQVLTIAVGEDRGQIDFQLQTGRPARVEGTVSMSDGLPLPRVTVLMTNAASSPLQSTRGSAVTEGRFSIPSVPPGSYTLQARTTEGTPLFASTDLEVDGLDVAGLQLTLLSPLTLSGRVAVDGSRPAGILTGRRITVTSLPVNQQVQVRPIDSAGAFTLAGVLPGRYVLSAPLSLGTGTDAVTLALQSVLVDGTNMTDLPLTIAPTAPPKDIVMTFGERWQELSGRVTNASGSGVSDYTVMLFPVSERYWLPSSRRIVTAQPDTDGRFSLGGPGPAMLPAGEYYLAAVTEVLPDEQYDPSFLQSLVSAAIRVTLQPGEKRTQNLAIR